MVMTTTTAIAGIAAVNGAPRSTNHPVTSVSAHMGTMPTGTDVGLGEDRWAMAMDLPAASSLTGVGRPSLVLKPGTGRRLPASNPRRSGDAAPHP
jgi:hypothetical protein